MPILLSLFIISLTVITFLDKPSDHLHHPWKPEMSTEGCGQASYAYMSEEAVQPSNCRIIIYYLLVMPLARPDPFADVIVKKTILKGSASKLDCKDQ